MLCGEFHNRGAFHLGLVGLQLNPVSPVSADCLSPYSSLLALLQGMATITAHTTTHEDEDIFLENGLLSYENPNYHLDPARLDDALNSNTDDIYEDLYQELDDICNLRTASTVATINMQQQQATTNTSGKLDQVGQVNGSGRKAYAALDIGSMGVDLNTGPVTGCGTIDTSYPDNRSLCEKSLKSATCNKDNRETLSVPHIAGQLNNDLYAVPVKRRPQRKSPEDTELASPEDKERCDETDLPPGWEKHEDNDGPYYWHIKSGTIQRELPEILYHEKKEIIDKSDFSKETDSLISKFDQSSMISSVTRSSTSSALDIDLDDRKKKDELAFKRRSYPARAEPESKERPIRFAVRSLGWVEIAEDDLTPERSSKAVNKCIVDLSLGRNDLLDVVGRWGDGKDLFMDLDEGALKLIDPENLTVLNTQPIHTIRVWGVGRDNGRERDFAYVARDRTTRKHMCHVFRCDMPARTIANTLRDICKKIMIERSLQQNLARPIDVNGGRTNGQGSLNSMQMMQMMTGGQGYTSGGVMNGCLVATRPTSLQMEHRRGNRVGNGQVVVAQSFPTPMEEPKKVLRAQYLGCLQVNQATGMEVLNEAIDRVVTNIPQDQWQAVNVAVAPSMISILQPSDDKLLAECRVRYLSFLGIGKNVKQCAFIMHTAQDTFMAHIFHCEPSSGALCKTVEAACKLRYQKCLDAHPQGLGRSQSSLHTPGKTFGQALKSIVGSLTGRKSKSAES